MKLSKMNITVLTITLISVITLIGRAEGLAVMSIDIGSEWMKVAIVSPGVPMEIALNKESKRKTPVSISFYKGERSFGEDAQVIGVKYPNNTYNYILDLLGKPIDNPVVQLFQKRFPYYNIIANNDRNTIAFRHNENNTYTPEELLAQILHKGKEMAELSAGQKIKEAVITVPGFFNQAERKALLQAAELANIKVLQLINDYTAVALNYGIFQRKNLNDSAKYVMFYDVGASSTSATIVSYQNVKTKGKMFAEVNPHVTVLGVGYDRTLGGLEVQIRLQQYLAREFDSLKKTNESVFDSPRAMAKLFKEAGRLKTVLSANPNHYAQIEGLLNEIDFKLQVTREKLEELCSDLFDRVANPVKTALETSGLTMDIISQVVLVGAGTRMPKIQETLYDFVKMNLSHNLNTDEAAVLGAVYKAADLSQGFKVKKFITKDAVLFPIQIVFDRTVDDKVKQVRRMLFSKMNTYPQKKIITFNKHTDDFEFNVNYAELEYLPSHEIPVIGNLNLSIISLSGIASALEKQTKDGAESKGIKAHFQMDESGILNLTNVELVFEKTSTSIEEEEGTFSKLGSTITKLFAGSDDKETTENTEEPHKEDIKPVHEEFEYNEPQKESDNNKSDKNETSTLDEKLTANKTEKLEKEKKPTIVTVKEPIKAEETKLGPKPLNEDEFITSRQKIEDLNHHDMEKTRRETAFNNLESFVIDAQLKLDTDEYKIASTQEEIDKILSACSEVSEWLYEDGFEATTETYEKKLDDLKKLTADLFERVFEQKARPEVIQAMVSILNGSKMYLAHIRNQSISSEIFTPIEIETLEKTIQETQEYHDIVIQSFAETKLHEPIKYKARDIANKVALLDREIKYLANKAKIWRPKQDSSANKTEGSAEGAAESADSIDDKETTQESSTEKEKVETDTEPQVEVPLEEEEIVLPEVDTAESSDQTVQDDSHIEL